VLVDAINSGAVDRYVQKPWDSKELAVILKQAITTFATVRENRGCASSSRHYAGYLEREQRDALDFGELAAEPRHARSAARSPRWRPRRRTC
jgi:two-component system response regulator AtoC